MLTMCLHFQQEACVYVKQRHKGNGQETGMDERKYACKKKKNRKKEKQSNFQLRPHVDHVLQREGAILFFSHSGLKLPNDPR